MKKLSIFILIISISFTFIGCSKDEVVIKSSKFFEGDAERIGAHLEMITGCIKINYSGDKNVRTKYEIWENGELEDSKDGISIPAESVKRENEISISIQDDIKTGSMNMKYMVKYSEGYGGFTQSLEGINLFNTDEENWGFGTVEIQDAIHATDNGEIAVWGVIAFNGSKYKSPNNSRTIEEQVKDAEWGLVLKVYFE